MLLKFFSDESSCEVEIEKTFLVMNSNENGTLEISDVCLILSPLKLSVVVQTVQLKYDFCCRSERVFLLIFCILIKLILDAPKSTKFNIFVVSHLVAHCT